jgi:DNA-directed RNA polymerase specialized sigma24 family protein
MPFETTRWSLVSAARGDDSDARSALAKLCEMYCYPLYAYARRWGANPDDACDLTQGFLASLIERRDFENLRREHGRFRSFLLASLQHFLANEAARRHAQKRGGHAVLVPFVLDDAERRYSVEPPESATPETLYERRWALTVIDGVLAELRHEWSTTGRAAEFDALKACLLGDAPAGGYTAGAEKLNTTEGAMRVAVHRLRRKFQKRLKETIAQTVSDEADIDDEIRYLIRALNA